MFDFEFIYEVWMHPHNLLEQSLMIATTVIVAFLRQTTTFVLPSPTSSWVLSWRCWRRCELHSIAVQSWGRDCPAISVVSYFVCCQFCVYHVALTKILDLPQRFAGYSYIGSTEDLNKQVFIMQAILATFTSCSHNSPEFKVFANATYITTYIIIFYLKYILFLLNLWVLSLMGTANSL
jgi:hypothetical protein